VSNGARVTLGQCISEPVGEDDVAFLERYVKSPSPDDQERVEKLCDLDQTEEDYLSSLSENNPQDFKSVLYSVFSKKSGEASENENGESVGCGGGKNGAAEEDNEADSDEVRH